MTTIGQKEELAKDHIISGPFRGCRCVACYTAKRRMTAAELTALPGLPSYRKRKGKKKS